MKKPPKSPKPTPNSRTLTPLSRQKSKEQGPLQIVTPLRRSPRLASDAPAPIREKTPKLRPSRKSPRADGGKGGNSGRVRKLMHASAFRRGCRRATGGTRSPMLNEGNAGVIVTESGVLAGRKESRERSPLSEGSDGVTGCLVQNLESAASTTADRNGTISPGEERRRSPRSPGTGSSHNGGVNDGDLEAGRSEDESLTLRDVSITPNREGLEENTLTYPRSQTIKLTQIFNEAADSSDEQPSKRIKILGTLGQEVQDRKLLRRSPRKACFQPETTDALSQSAKNLPLIERKFSEPSKKKSKKCKTSCFFIGDPTPYEEAEERWHWRYEMKNQMKGQKLTEDNDDEDKIFANVQCHYSQASIVGCIFNLGDCAYIKGEGKEKHIGRILEFFRTTDGEDYFRVQWFYRAEDTVMREQARNHDKKRVFYSTVMNDNPIDCIISKATVVQVPPEMGLKSNYAPQADFYFDMEYCVEYSTFRVPLTDNIRQQDLSPATCIDTLPTLADKYLLDNMPHSEKHNAELSLLDLYSGCGGMSTGLFLGTKVSCVDLVTRWAVDGDKSACESLKLNHSETHVRNEAASNFLFLLKDWRKLCKQYALSDMDRTPATSSRAPTTMQKNSNPANDDITPDGECEVSDGKSEVSDEEFEVESILDICYGDPEETGKHGLKFKVRWKGYDSSEDTWEPIEGLSNCQESIKDFVRKGFQSGILPLPGDADVICGGPPCQGISGYNRFRNVDTPMDDERNRQITVFMDIVQFLKPKFVLMENVTDILRFDKASLARYALSRLVHMRYQAQLGTMAAGGYGLPQFRLRVFLWGAHPNEKLPQFPLPTHDVIVRYWPPPEFERNIVGYDEDHSPQLEETVVLRDAISDLPAVTNDEKREEISYEKPPETEFQRYIRSSEHEMTGIGSTRIKSLLYDHRPQIMFEDDFLRVCKIPKRKGACFRDLPGLVVGPDNVVRRDPKQEPVLLPSGRLLVPDYALTYDQGKSKRPFARLWWDETVSTVVTVINCHSQPTLHPEQDRVLTIRECARLQGFPDYYRFSGTVKERYCQIGNAVAVPVARALGYSLGLAVRKLGRHEPNLTLPPKFSHSNCLQLETYWTEHSYSDSFP